MKRAPMQKNSDPRPELEGGDGAPVEPVSEETAAAAPADAAAAESKSLFHCLSHTDTYILNSVMVVNVGIAFRLDLQVKQGVFRKQIQHVIKEAYTCIYRTLTLTVQIKRQSDTRLTRLSVYV